MLWSTRSCRVHVAMQEIIRKQTAETVKNTRKRTPLICRDATLGLAGHCEGMTSWQLCGADQKAHVTLGVLASLLLVGKFRLKLYGDIVPLVTFENAALPYVMSQMRCLSVRSSSIVVAGEMIVFANKEHNLLNPCRGFDWETKFRLGHTSEEQMFILCNHRKCDEVMDGNFNCLPLLWSVVFKGNLLSWIGISGMDRRFFTFVIYFIHCLVRPEKIKWATISES